MVPAGQGSIAQSSAERPGPGNELNLREAAGVRMERRQTTNLNRLCRTDRRPRESLASAPL
eukprot:scaffold109495_cov26-Tisochrysis_lutea.AAC.3